MMRHATLLLAVALLAHRVAAADDDPPPFQIPQVRDVKIDADGGDWRDRGFRIDVLAPADGVIVPSTDFDSLVRIAWDKRGLLVLVNVVDDVIRESDDDAKLADGDSVEMEVSGPDYLKMRYVIAPGVDPAHQQLRVGDDGGPRVEARAGKTAAGYCIEALFPMRAAHGDGTAFRFQIAINDSDRPGTRKRYVWPLTDRGTTHLIGLGLTPGPPVSVAAIASYLDARTTRVTVLAPSDDLGKRIEVSRGPSLRQIAASNDTGLPLAVDNIRPIADRTGAYLNIAPTPLGASEKPINVYIDSKLVARVMPPNNDPRRLVALSEIDLKFQPAVFAGDAFPPCDFADPALARDLMGGSYHIKSTFYDAAYVPVDKPAAPGRYGAVVEVTTDTGFKLPSRLVSLYRQKDGAPWREVDVKVQLALPPQIGLDEQVVKEQQGVLGQFMRERLIDDFAADSDTPLLIAALAESKSGDPQLAGRNSIWAKDQRWWYPLKQRLGRTRYTYLIDLPARYGRVSTPFPLLLFLHGSGERGGDLVQVRANGPAKLCHDTWHPLLLARGDDDPHASGFIVVSPQCPANEWWSAQQLAGVIDDVCEKYRVDPDRIYVTGLSMGGYGAWELAAEYPDRFAAIAPLCGAGSPADAARLKDLPTWIFHGQRDTAVPFERGAEMAGALKAVGGRVKFTAYPDLGHDCWTKTYDNPELYDWLLKQKRGAPAEPPAR